MINTALLQLVAYTSLTVASVTVATVSAIFGYRQNYGWKPIALVTSHGLSGTGGSNKFNALLTIEFWNRRKYPVAVGGVTVKFKTINFAYAPSPNEKGWSRIGAGYFKRVEQRLEPAAHIAVEFTAPFEADSIDALRDAVEVVVNYFDPVSGKGAVAETQHTYTFQVPATTPVTATIERT